VRILVGMPEQGSRGGPGACEPPFIQELRRLGHEVEEEVYAHAEADAGLANRTQRVLKTGRRFRRRVRARSFDLVHINTSFDTKALLRDAFIVPSLSSLGAKIFLKFHGSNARLLETKNPVLAASRRRLLMHADSIGVLSSEERDNFLRARVPVEKLFQIKNVVEPNVQQRNPAFLRRWHLPDDVPLLLFIGRFIPAKGLLDVIRACALLRERKQKFLALFLGDGPSRSDAEALVANLKLQDCARFFGYIPEEQTAEFYANSTILLFPTYHYEGFPMVVFQAAAAGLPIITTRIRAAADYLQEPNNCLWAPQQKPDVLAEKIIDLLKDSALRESMSFDNKKLAAQFSAEAVTREYVKAYEQIVK
jgi:glycosyltransferase involved in cell wall biosynthesis